MKISHNKGFPETLNIKTTQPFFGFKWSTALVQLVHLKQGTQFKLQ